MRLPFLSDVRRTAPTGPVRLLPLLLPALLLALAGAPVDARAQQQAGDIELQFIASLLGTVGGEGESKTQGTFQAKGGYFLTDRVEVGAFPGLVFTRATVRSPGWPNVPDQTISETRFGLGVFTTYSFLAADATTVPYVGAQFYRIDLSDEDEGGWIGGNAGLKFYFNPRTAFDVGGNALMGIGNSDGVLLHLQMGLSFLL
jgi:hypothetical protein